MRHPSVSKYCITDSLVKGCSESLALAFVYGWLQVCLQKYHLTLYLAGYLKLIHHTSRLPVLCYDFLSRQYQ